MRLTAQSADEPQRLIRFMTGALVACGGWVLTRGVCGEESADICFEFARASCVEIYAVLIASGLELSREAHLKLTELCHCTKSLIETKAFDIARMQLTIYTQKAAASEPERHAEGQARVA